MSISCGKKKVATAAPPPPPVVGVDSPPSEQPAEPISAPQTTAKLPPPQPVPPEAVYEIPGPLTTQQDPEPTAVSPAEPQEEPSATHAAEPAGANAPLPEPPPAPQLGQILTAEERQQYNTAIDRSIEGAQNRLEFIRRHSLRADQIAAVRRIRAFIGQALEARKRDLVLAKNLADRAQLLAEDLARSFR